MCSELCSNSELQGSGLGGCDFRTQNSEFRNCVYLDFMAKFPGLDCLKADSSIISKLPRTTLVLFCVVASNFMCEMCA